MFFRKPKRCKEQSSRLSLWYNQLFSSEAMKMIFSKDFIGTPLSLIFHYVFTKRVSKNLIVSSPPWSLTENISSHGFNGSWHGSWRVIWDYIESISKLSYLSQKRWNLSLIASLFSFFIEWGSQWFACSEFSTCVFRSL